MWSIIFFFFFKQKTAYEMRISDWSSDVCSSDLSYGNSFTCIPSRVQYREPRRTPRPHVAGVQTAIVTGPQGNEIYIDDYGRVKVQFHWDRQGTYDDKSSCWVRVAQGHAGEIGRASCRARVCQYV